MKKQDNEQAKTGSADSFSSGQIGAALSINHSNATDEVITGMADFLTEAGRRSKSLANPELIDIAQGYLFEAIEVTKFNRAAAEAGTPYRAVLTASIKGRATDTVDIEIRVGNKVVKNIQAKSSRSAARSLHQITQDRYRGMDKLIPKEQVDKAKQLASRRASSGSIKAQDYKDSVKNLKGEIEVGKVKSGGTKYKETLKAARKPEAYAARMEARSLAEEAASTGLKSAGVGAIISGAISAIKNTYNYQKGRITGEEALANVAADTGKGAAKTGAAAGTGTLIRYSAKKFGSKPLAKSNVAAAIAASAIDAGITIHKYARGEISGAEAMQEIGQNGTSAASGIFIGAAAGAVFGPAGALVGSVGGFIVSSSVYQSCLAILKNADLEEKEAERIEALCAQSIKEINQQKKEFEKQLSAMLKEKDAAFDKLISNLSTAYASDNYIGSFNALTDLSFFMGSKLKFKDFEEFDDFMTSSDGPLVL